MRYLNHLIIFTMLTVVTVLSGCASGERVFSKGEKLEADGKYEDAMYSYAEAFRIQPDVGNYRVRFFRARDIAAQKRFERGMISFEKTEYAAALEDFQTALGLDPTQDRFKQKIDETTRLKNAQSAFNEAKDFEKSNKLKDAHRLYAVALEYQPTNKDYQVAYTRIDKKRKNKISGVELSLKSTKPITLKFKEAKMKDVFRIVTQLSGVNFIFDEGVKDQPVSIYIENATFQQALDLLTTMNKLERKVLNETTVLVFSHSPEKTKQYEDLTVRTFHLSYMDAKKAVNLIRTMLQIRKVYVNEDNNSIVVRDTKDVVNVVEKILDSNDVPEPEVVLDVEVVEVSDKNAQNVGLLLSNYNVQLGAFNSEGKPLASALSAASTTDTTATTTTTSKSADVSNLIRAFTMKGYGGFVTVPSAQYNLGKTLTKGEVLSNPKIRVKNKEKSKFNVGTRVPITTTTLNGTLSQVNVQYVDVGVKVNAEPTILLNNEITIKLGLEVSSILSKETVGGSTSPTSVVTIGTRNLDTVLSLKDGETSVIGGLIQNTQNNTKQKVFLLSDIPLIGSLLTNHDNSKDKTELILAITPRLVRGVTVPQSNLMSFTTGKEDAPQLVNQMSSFDDEPVFETTPAKVITQASGVQIVDKKPEPLSNVRPGIATTATQQPLGATADKPAAPGIPVLIQQPTVKPVKQTTSIKRGLMQIVVPSTVKLGEQFTLDVKVSDIQQLMNSPFVLTFDPVFFNFVSASEGNFLKQDGKQTTFSTAVDSGSGTVNVKLALNSGNSAVSGNGVLLSIRFKAKNQGSANFSFRNVNLQSPDGKTLAVLPFSASVDVK